MYDPKDPSISRFPFYISIIREVIEYISLFALGAAVVVLWSLILG